LFITVVVPITSNFADKLCALNVKLQCDVEFAHEMGQSIFQTPIFTHFAELV